MRAMLSSVIEIISDPRSQKALQLTRLLTDALKCIPNALILLHALNIIVKNNGNTQVISIYRAIIHRVLSYAKDALEAGGFDTPSQAQVVGVLIIHAAGMLGSGLSFGFVNMIISVVEEVL